MDWWFAIWECFYYEPIKFFAILFGIMLALCLIIYLIEWIADCIRYKRWADRQIWYINSKGQIYRKDHSHDYDDDRQR